MTCDWRQLFAAYATVILAAQTPVTVVNHRTVLYMGALVGSYRNPVLRELYQRLLEAGKPKKLALVACMRKLLTILNSLMRTGEVDPINRTGG